MDISSVAERPYDPRIARRHFIGNYRNFSRLDRFGGDTEERDRKLKTYNECVDIANNVLRSNSYLQTLSPIERGKLLAYATGLLKDVAVEGSIYSREDNKHGFVRALKILDSTGNLRKSHVVGNIVAKGFRELEERGDYELRNELAYILKAYFKGSTDATKTQ